METEKWQTSETRYGGGVPHVKVVSVAYGAVKMWGEVVEHERGYRAQFAKLVSLTFVVGDLVNEYALRKKYGV